jgi:hypothetical protein
MLFQLINSVPPLSKALFLLVLLLSFIGLWIPISEEEENTEAEAHLTPVLALVPGRYFILV